MNEKFRKIFKNLNYTISSNFLVLGISIILNLVVPKYLGIEAYGYWQLYIFYSSYVGLFHLGIVDGIYLKIGGEEYDDLDKRSLGTQFNYLLKLEFLFAVLLSLYSILFVTQTNQKIIWFAISVLLIVANSKSFVLFILQSTNRIKEYAQLNRNDKYLYLIITTLYLSFGGRNPLVLIFIDVISKLIVTIWGITRIKDIITAQHNNFDTTILEIKDNIIIGSNLMLGSIASMLVLGISRFFVERHWSIEVFGKLSFALSISNMFMLFISSISIVLYPLLRRENPLNLAKVYLTARTLFVPFTLLLLLFFYPVRIILEWWLPKYQSSLFFMGILFPMVVYEGRMLLLINTYLKTIRREKIIMTSNIITLVLSSVLSFISVYILDSIELTVFFILFSIAFRSVFSEIILGKILNVKVLKDNVIELSVTLSFVIGNVFFSNLESLIIYLLVFTLYLLFYWKRIANTTKEFFNILITK